MVLMGAWGLPVPGSRDSGMDEGAWGGAYLSLHTDSGPQINMAQPSSLLAKTQPRQAHSCLTRLRALGSPDTLARASCVTSGSGVALTGGRGGEGLGIPAVPGGPGGPSTPPGMHPPLASFPPQLGPGLGWET